MKIIEKYNLSEQNIDRIIEMAWEDRTPFDAIKVQFEISEGKGICAYSRFLREKNKSLKIEFQNDDLNISRFVNPLPHVLRPVLILPIFNRLRRFRLRFLHFFLYFPLFFIHYFQ